MTATIEDRLQCDTREEQSGESRTHPAEQKLSQHETTDLGSQDLSTISLFPQQVGETLESDNQVQEVEGMDPAMVLGGFFKVSSRVANNDDGGMVTAEMLMHEGDTDDVQFSSTGRSLMLSDDDLRSLMRYGTRGTASSSK